jgi:Na+-driven multidrug efflux pump
MWILGGIAVINLPLAWGLYHGYGPLPHLGFVGIALGTGLSHVVGGLIVLGVLAGGRAGLKWKPQWMRPDPWFLWRLLRIGVPAAVDSLSIVAGQLWFLSIVNERLDKYAIAAHGIALGWEAMGYLSGAAFGTAAMTLVGQNLGAQRPDTAARGAWWAFGMGCGVMCFMGVVFFALAPQMFLIFCPAVEQEAVIRQGVPVLRLVAFAMPCVACCIVFTYALRGAGDTRVPVLFSWIGFLAIRIPLAYVLTSKELHLGLLGDWQGCNLGLLGAWIAMFADLFVRGGFYLFRFCSARWQKMWV